MNLLLFISARLLPAKNAQNITTRPAIGISYKKGGWGAQRRAKKVGGGPWPQSSLGGDSIDPAWEGRGGRGGSELASLIPCMYCNLLLAQRSVPRMRKSMSALRATTTPARRSSRSSRWSPWSRGSRSSWPGWRPSSPIPSGTPPPHHLPLLSCYFYVINIITSVVPVFSVVDPDPYPDSIWIQWGP